MTSGDSKAVVGKDFPRDQAAANDEVNLCVRNPVDEGRNLQTQHLRAALREAFVRVLTPLYRLLTRWRRARRDAQAIAELQALDERVLRDIGITHRSQITVFVKSARAREASQAHRGEPGVVDIRSRSTRDASRTYNQVA